MTFKYVIVSILITNLIVINLNGSAGQDQDPNIEAIVNELFSSTTRTPPRRGFDKIVTPEPIVGPTTEPQILINNGRKCICVPYYLCDPTDKTIRTDGEYDGFGQIDIRFDSESCQDVLDVCCTDDRRQAEPITPPPISQKPGRPTGCGIRNKGLDFTIVGDNNNESGFGEFPWTVAILRMSVTDECVCVGSLIHPQVILTGSHCVIDENGNNLKVRAGEWDTQTVKERLPYQEQRVQRVIMHPEYNRRTLVNDFALLILEKPFVLADHISPICLPPQNYVSNSRNCFASGWGKDVFGKAGKYSVIMKRVELPIVPNGQCETSLRKTRLGNRFVLSPTFICAGGEPGVDTCQGDGGAPLVCPVGPSGENRYLQSGIVAWGIGCNEDRPAVYANVALVRNWIDSQMNELGFGTSTYSY